MLFDHLLRQFIVTIQQSTPCLVPHLGGAARRIDDIRKQNRGEDAFEIGRRTLAMSGDKLLDVTKHRLHIAGKVERGHCRDIQYIWRRGFAPPNPVPTRLEPEHRFDGEAQVSERARSAGSP